MEKLGTMRRIDDLGRLPIPKELRKALGVEGGDGMDIRLEGKRIIIEKHHDPLEELNHLLDNIIDYVEELPNFDGDYLDDLNQCLKLTNELAWEDK